MNELENLEPKRLWKHFYDLTQVPHPSYHLEKMQQHLLEFGKKIGVETILDEAGNVILRKPATPGQEHRKGIVMQAHMDMVPQKRKGCNHDFLTDPLKPYVDGEWVRATDTTLGADDGMGVAAAMAIMEDDTLVHGPLEALFTVNEETGLEGAFGLKEDALKGSYLLNMDSEDEGEFTVGCAGGLNIFASMEYKPEVADVTDKAFKISLAGLYGGHSGMEIGTGRGNANKMMARVVYDAIAECDAELAEWHGGNMHNAIPRECEAVVTVPAGNEDVLTSLISDYQAQFNEEYKGYPAGSLFVSNFRTVRPFEAYSVHPTAAAKRVNEARMYTVSSLIGGETGTTGIIDVMLKKNDGANSDAVVKVYSLSGALIKQGKAEDVTNGLPKGVYVANGKKFVVK